MMGIQAIMRDPAQPSTPEIKIPTELETEVTAPATTPPVPPAAAVAAAPAVAVPAPAPAPPRVPKARAPTPPPVGSAPSIEIDPSLLEATETQPVIDPAAPAAGGNGVDDGEIAVVAQAWPPPDVAPAASAPPAWIKAQGHPAAHVPAPPVLPNVRAVTDADTGFFKETGPQERISEGRIGYVTDSNTGFFQETGAQQALGYGTDDMTAMVQAPPGKKRMLVIVVSCIAVFVLGFIGILVFGAKRPSNDVSPAKPPKTPAVAKGSAITEPPPVPPPPTSGSDGSAGSGSAQAVVVPPPTTGSDATGSGSGSAAATGSGSGSGSAEPSPPPDGDDTGEEPAPPPPEDGATKIGTGQCKVKVTSSPSGSEVVVAGKSRGRTPLDLAMTCASTQIAVRKTHYNTYTKTVKPTTKKTVKLNAKLARVTFTVKVSSIPSGATVLVNGRKSGKTPTAVKVPGFAGTTITLTKDGFANQAERVTAKQNGTAIRMVLKKK
jgi:hypothetical protein